MPTRNPHEIFSVLFSNIKDLKDIEHDDRLKLFFLKNEKFYFIFIPILIISQILNSYYILKKKNEKKKQNSITHTRNYLNNRYDFLCTCDLCIFLSHNEEIFFL